MAGGEIMSNSLAPENLYRGLLEYLSGFIEVSSAKQVIVPREALRVWYPHAKSKMAL
jgi:hypothetical protein